MKRACETRLRSLVPREETIVAVGTAEELRELGHDIGSGGGWTFVVVTVERLLLTAGNVGVDCACEALGVDSPWEGPDPLATGRITVADLVGHATTPAFSLTRDPSDMRHRPQLF
jgi:hypothetical protein